MSSLILKIIIVILSINLVSCTLLPKQRPLKAKLQRKALLTKLLMRKHLAKMLLKKPCLLTPKVLLFLKPYAHVAKLMTQLVQNKRPCKQQPDRVRAGLRQKGGSPFKNSPLTNAGDGFAGENDPPPAIIGPRNLLTRAFRSFANHDEHTLDEVSPMLQPVHHLLRSTGRAILPPPLDQQAVEDQTSPLFIPNTAK